MPNATSGFTAQEIIDRVSSFIGNDSEDFITYVQNSLPLAEFRWCKAHDWSFLRKIGLPLAVSNGTSEYNLSSATIGFYMSAEDVETIFSPTGSTVLKRTNLAQIRRADPEGDDGSTATHPQAWAPAGDNRIVIWPPQFQSQTLYVDGKISPSPLLTLSNYPTVPFRYQDSFIEYVTALALDRESDDRASQKKVEVLSLIQQDIRDDLRQLSNTDYPRIMHWQEAALDGAGANLEALLFGLIGSGEW
jgi:hypothetical protein